MADTSKFPRSFGLLIYPQFEVLDAMGPIEALNCLARTPGFEDMTLSIISKTLDPVSVGPLPPDTLGQNFTGRQVFTPTHTFETAPHLDVLLVPGGLGSVDPHPAGSKIDIDGHVQFVKNAYNGTGGRKPLQYLISVCNGPLLLLKAEVLDGHKATTNKDWWSSITAQGPKTHWIAKARWVDSGRIWSTSGVSAGTDGVLAWMQSLIGPEIVESIVDNMEWIRAESADNDPFAIKFGCKDVPPKET